MPNHETNTVVVIGPPESIRLFIDECLIDYPLEEGETIGDRPAKVIDFQSIYPMPEELQNTVSPHEIAATQEEADRKNAEYNASPMGRFGREDRPPQLRFLTQEEVDRRRTQYLAVDWYDWATQNWGTKWGAYSPSHYSLRWFTDDKDQVYGRVDLVFETAWSQPTPIFQRIEADYGLEVHAITQDEGGAPDVEYGSPYEKELISKTVSFDFTSYDSEAIPPADEEPS